MTTAMGYSNTGQSPTAASLASAGFGPNTATEAGQGTVNLPDGPRPVDQLPRLAAETTAQNPWPVSMLSQKSVSYTHLTLPTKA